MVPSGGDAAQAPAHNVRMSDSQLAKAIASRIAATTWPPPGASTHLAEPSSARVCKLYGNPFTEDHRVLDRGIASAKYPVPVVG